MQYSLVNIGRGGSGGGGIILTGENVWYTKMKDAMILDQSFASRDRDYCIPICTMADMNY